MMKYIDHLNILNTTLNNIIFIVNLPILPLKFVKIVLTLIQKKGLFLKFFVIYISSYTIKLLIILMIKFILLLEIP